MRTRLNKWSRAVLKDRARTAIERSTDHSERDRLHAQAETALLAEIEQQYPIADMMILKKYDAARHQKSIYSDDREFVFSGPAPLIPGRAYDCRIKISRETKHLIDLYENERDRDLEEIRNRMRDYASLIDGCVTFEALVDVWPAAAECRDEIVRERSLPTIVSKELVDRIRSENLQLAA